MAPPDDGQKAPSGPASPASPGMQDYYMQTTASSVTGGMQVPRGVPVLMLINSSLNIRLQGVNGAVIGRRQGPYAQFFEQNMYVSGVHAQLIYRADNGWCVVDKHSSNGTKLNQRPLQPDVEMSLKNGDILTIANINLEVNVR
jgi:pSer/pThr/pTyr-binding forkhead associated (FHA) protein